MGKRRAWNEHKVRKKSQTKEGTRESKKLFTTDFTEYTDETEQKENT
jgi:hypothetical protein